MTGAGATLGGFEAKALAARVTPLHRLALAVVVAIVVLGGVIAFAVGQPWLGLNMQYDARAGGFVVRSVKGPSSDIPLGTVIVAVSGSGDRLQMERLDLTGQVDGAFGPFADFTRFMDRQGRYAAMQAGAELTLIDKAGHGWTIHPHPGRPITSLGIDFWIGIVVGAVSWLMASAIAAFRPGDAAARYILLSGAAMLACGPIGPIYTSRELALPETAFYLINGCNCLGGMMYAAAFIGVMLYYPKPLAPRWVGQVVVALTLGWYVAQAAGAFPDLTFARRLPALVAVAATTILSAVQWRLTRRDPLARAALGWFLLTWVVMVNAFVFLILAPQLFDIDTSAVEPYGFLLFVLVYVGLAIGIMRHRLFELGDWWVRIVTWLLGLVLLAALDMALLVGLGLSSGASLALSLLVCGLIWLPVRTWLAGRMLGRRKVDERAVFEGISQAALAPSAAERTARWTAVLRQQFDPLHVAPADAVPAVRLEQDGLALVTPAVHGLPSLRLDYARSGRALFAPADLHQAEDLVRLLDMVIEGRDAYERGIVNERRRIAGDIHDNLGAALLSALHSREAGSKDRFIRDGLADLRVIVTDQADDAGDPADLLAAARTEMAERLETHGVRLDWPASPAPPRALEPKRLQALRAMLRELTNNVIKHAHATRVRVELVFETEALTLTVEDDGVGFDPAAPTTGIGVSGLAHRAARHGGKARWTSRPEVPGARVVVRLPYAAND